MIFGFSYTTWAHQCLKKQVKSPSLFSRPLHPPKVGSGRDNINVIKLINNGWNRCITKLSNDMMISTFPILNLNDIDRISFFVHFF